MKESQKRHFKHSDCDCRDCQRSGIRQFGYAVLVLILLVGSLGSLVVIAEVLR
jgi:hypothetical protein